MRNSLGLKRGEVRLVRHTTAWKRIYSREKQLIRKTLGKNIVIEHVGSTAIPTISAKPIVDILAGASSLKDVKHKVLRLKKVGYGHIKRFPNSRLQIILAKGKRQRTYVYLHLVRYNGVIWKNYIVFRDYLLENPKIAVDYDRLKKKLAKKYALERMQYTKLKELFVHRIIAKGMKEKKR